MTILLLSLMATADAEPAVWRDPPAPIPQVLDARRPPSPQISRDAQWLILLDKPDLPPLSVLAAPEVALAGLKIDPRTYGPAEENPYRGAAIRRLDAKGPGTPIGLPEGARIRNVSFSPDDKRMAISLLTSAGIEMWVADVGPAPVARKLVGPELHAVAGEPCVWLTGDDGMACKIRPKTSPPAAPEVPAGPRIEENLGQKKPTRTNPDLLKTDYDRALFSHFIESKLVKVGLDGTQTPLTDGAISGLSRSPDGKWLLVYTLEGPWSSEVTMSSFARRVEALELGTGKKTEVARLEVADKVPVSFDAVRPGRRSIGWRNDQAATLYLVEALDGGDPKVDVPHRDLVTTWAAPFSGAPVELARTQTRFAGLEWGDGDLALLWEQWWATRKVKTWTIAPDHPEKAPTLLWDRSSQDQYSDPGSPVYDRGPYVADVMKRTKSGALLLEGEGATPEGQRPFLDRLELGPTPKTTRLWQASLDRYESLTKVLDSEGAKLLTWRQSQKEVPNLFVVEGKKSRALTEFKDWAPQLAGIRQELLTYTRKDGVKLSATVYLPPGYNPKKDKPRPAVLWVYPSEFKRASDASQVTTTTNTFSRPGGTSHLFFLMRGWIVVDDPTLPIVGEGDVQPNDTYVAQLTDGAQAAVDALTAKGWVDPDKLVVGGHSYGAFTTANLLAHTDLFRAGIARSGAYNRTLTPFGFQGEERTYWEAPETYDTMSPFAVADKINEPILMIHGADDKNPGTWPVQSQRLFEALKGLGATVRFVELPFEGHGYRARESAGQTLAEMIDWAEKWTAEPRKAP